MEDDIDSYHNVKRVLKPISLKDRSLRVSSDILAKRWETNTKVAKDTLKKIRERGFNTSEVISNKIQN